MKMYFLESTNFLVMFVYQLLQQLAWESHVCFLRNALFCKSNAFTLSIVSEGEGSGTVDQYLYGIYKLEYGITLADTDCSKLCNPLNQLSSNFDQGIFKF